MSNFRPSYIKLYNEGVLKKRIKDAWKLLENCTLCPRKCKVNRLKGETGDCKTADRAWISSYQPHFGEEAPLVGSKGSGTIFFTHCNLNCIFCQNFDISNQGQGRDVSDIKLSEMMLFLQSIGCHNINFVTPSHVVPQILSALDLAIGRGLEVPLIYNSGGYDSVETLNLLDGIFDIYMPDFKFWGGDISRRACNAGDYPGIAGSAIKEMHRQVGDLIINDSGIAERGLLVRHLVMPYGLAGTKEIMRFISDELSLDTYVNIMPQYRPCGRAYEIPELSDRIIEKDFSDAIQAAAAAGLTRIDNRYFT